MSSPFDLGLNKNKIHKKVFTLLIYLWCFLQFVFVRCSWHRGKPQEGQSPTLGLGSEHSSQSGTLEGPAICDILLGRVMEKGDGSGDGDGDGY